MTLLQILGNRTVDHVSQPIIFSLCFPLSLLFTNFVIPKKRLNKSGQTSTGQRYFCKRHDSHARGALVFHNPFIDSRVVSTNLLFP